jgi:transcription antitermination factor NusG
MLMRRRKDEATETERWYALDVVRQKEYLAGYILNRMGYPTFIPTETRWRKKNRYAKSKSEIAFAAVPGTIFVQLPLMPPWPRILDLSPVAGVLSIGDVPVPLDTKELWKYRATQLDGRLVVERAKVRGKGGETLEVSQRSIFVQGRGILRAPKEQRHMRSKREVKEGGEAMIAEGPFRFFAGRVVKIAGARAKVLLPLFGSKASEDGGVMVTVPLGDLEAVK